MKQAFTYTWDEPDVEIITDMGEWPRIWFSDFLAELTGVGFITSSDLLERLHEKERRDRVVVQGRPVSGALSWQGKLKALGHVMRAHGHRPVKSTHGSRGYRL